MESYTFAQAEQLTGVTRKALRNRVYRGQLQSVLRGRVRHIPRSELERIGLLKEDSEIDEIPELSRGASHGASHETALLGELLDRLEAQAAELGQLRALTREADSLRADRERLEEALWEQRAKVTELEARLAQAERPRRWWHRRQRVEAVIASEA